MCVYASLVLSTQPAVITVAAVHKIRLPNSYIVPLLPLLPRLSFAGFYFFSCFLFDSVRSPRSPSSAAPSFTQLFLPSSSFVVTAAATISVAVRVDVICYTCLAAPFSVSSTLKLLPLRVLPNNGNTKFSAPHFFFFFFLFGSVAVGASLQTSHSLLSVIISNKKNQGSKGHETNNKT